MTTELISVLQPLHEYLYPLLKVSYEYRVTRRPHTAPRTAPADA